MDTSQKTLSWLGISRTTELVALEEPSILHRLNISMYKKNNLMNKFQPLGLFFLIDIEVIINSATHFIMYFCNRFIHKKTTKKGKGAVMHKINFSHVRIEYVIFEYKTTIQRDGDI